MLCYAHVLPLLFFLSLRRQIGSRRLFLRSFTTQLQIHSVPVAILGAHTSHQKHEEEKNHEKQVKIEVKTGEKLEFQLATRLHKQFSNLSSASRSSGKSHGVRSVSVNSHLKLPAQVLRASSHVEASQERLFPQLFYAFSMVLAWLSRFSSSFQGCFSCLKLPRSSSKKVGAWRF